MSWLVSRFYGFESAAKVSYVTFQTTDLAFHVINESESVRCRHDEVVQNPFQEFFCLLRVHDECFNQTRCENGEKCDVKASWSHENGIVFAGRV